MKPWLLLAAAVASVVPSSVLAWGKTGHRVVAAIADPQLSGLARAHVKEILGGAESLDEAANWPDELSGGRLPSPSTMSRGLTDPCPSA